MDVPTQIPVDINTPQQKHSKVTPKNTLFVTLIVLNLVMILLLFKQFSPTQPKQEENRMMNVYKPARENTNRELPTTNTDSLDPKPYIFLSTQGTYAFVAQETKDGCKYYITYIKDNRNTDLDLNSECGTGEGGPYVSNFHGWANDNTFVTETSKGELVLTIIKDLDNITKKIEKYDNQKYTYIGVSTDLNNFLYKTTPDNNLVKYFVIRNSSIIKTFDIESNNNFEYDSLGEYVDPINNGVLIVNGIKNPLEKTDNFQTTNDGGCQCDPVKETCKKVHYTFKYYSFDSNKLSDLLETEDQLNYMCGRGCYPDRITPTKGKVVYSPHCTQLSYDFKKYLGPDNTITLDLDN